MTENQNRVAPVTGAAQGIGRGIALRLAQDGYDVAIADLDFQKEKGEGVVKEIEELGRKAVFVALDVTDKDAFEKAVDTTAEALGGLHTLVNNAGIAQVKPILEVTEEELEKIYRINVHSVFFGIQAAVRKFEEQGVKGKIVNAASIAAVKGFPILSAYSSTKFAVRGITQAAAQELAPKGHTVNAYAPGIVGTGMWDLIDEKLHEVNGKPIGQNLKENVDSIALGRIETPEDVAGVVSFFADERSDYVTGQVLLVDGGMLYN
ncbi:acetoin reductase [Micrococcus sp.]|uniref:acetoin reductase n=1 Tax=Micrococcus sp. TaxID=1271 RepID=UPI002A90D3F4|nr:acetoin reductase [Micrococcus sp.]MDY6054521.1 acetoin reductase [Micrococcus sp.]